MVPFPDAPKSIFALFMVKMLLRTFTATVPATLEIGWALEKTTDGVPGIDTVGRPATVTDWADGKVTATVPATVEMGCAVVKVTDGCEATLTEGVPKTVTAGVPGTLTEGTPEMLTD